MIQIKELIKAQVLLEDSLRVSNTESKLAYRASEVGDCKRALFLKKLNQDSEVPQFKNDDDKARVLMLLKDGAYHQKDITEWMVKVPGIVITNIEDGRLLRFTSPKGNLITVSGHPDGIIHTLENKNKGLLEVKGISTYYCKNLEDENLDQLKAIYPTGYRAIPQSRIYMEMFDADYTKIMLKDKNTSAWYEFTILRDEDKFLKLKKKIGIIADACMDQVPPPCDFIEGDKRCKYCPYPSHCGVR